MAPIEITEDYYAFLKVENTASFDMIKKSYRQLAVKLHPDKNASSSEATALFQRLVTAYETLSDPDKRRIYDIKWPALRTSSKPQTRDANKSQKKTPTDDDMLWERKQKDRRDRVAMLRQRRKLADDNIFEDTRTVHRLKLQLKRFQELDDEECRKERQRNSWLTYLTSPIFGIEEQSAEEKKSREHERLQRLASRRIKEGELGEIEKRIVRLRAAVERADREIAMETQLESQEMRQRELTRQEQVRREDEERQQEMLRQQRQRQQEWEAKRKEDERARQEQYEKDMKKRREEEAAARETDRFRYWEWYEEESQDAAQKAQSSGFERTSSSTFSSRGVTCRHDKYWPRIEGQHVCSDCHQRKFVFALQCPDCQKIACATCRKALKAK